MSTPTRPSNTTRTAPRKGVNASLQQHQRNRRAMWVALGIGAIVLIAGITALVASGGGDGTKDNAVQIQPVKVSGTPLPVYNSKVADAAIGTTAPVIDGKTFFGTDLSIKPGKATMIVFLAHWCPHCQAEVPRLVTWHHNGDAPTAEQLQVIGVATGTDTTLPNYPPSAWLVREEWPWPVLADDATSSAMAAFGFKNFPAFAILDDKGVVKFRGTGEIAIADLEAVLQQTLAV